MYVRTVAGIKAGNYTADFRDTRRGVPKLSVDRLSGVGALLEAAITQSNAN